MKKLLAILLAILCVMNLTVVSFAAEDVSYFDEETGTLYLMTENWIEDLGIEDDEALLDFIGKVKTVYFDEECSITGNFYYCIYFYNLEKIVVDEDSTEWFVYDNALYYNAISDDEEICGLACYPAKCPDKDIVLHPDATQFMVEAFNVYNPEFDEVFLNENEYNMYIIDEEQFRKIKGERSGIGNLMYIKFANIYVNDTQESIDEIIEEFECTLETYNKTLAVLVAGLCYFGLDDEHAENIERIVKEIEVPEDTDDLVAINEYHNAVYSGALDYISSIGYVEYTEEAHAQVGGNPEEYAYCKANYDFYYDLFTFIRDRGNPVKPLSTLTSGTCGDGVEWAIDRENGVLSITGNGAIADNYSGFDVFKGIATTVEIGSGITAIGENVFTGFTDLTETKYDGTQSQWNAVTVADGNDDLLKNVTVNPDPPVDSEHPEEEPTLWDKVVAFFIKIYKWFANLFRF